ncbi:DUF1998 domain-containing protein [Peribacillus frigoritolerans]|uniref:DUF1998 domain-containing protein n=1 Tax=Peribacillus frigoritolerans TaxID=450367 RepID=UPI0021A9A647|nr:DUF1998 domain-containing protein [Peribacillus frigoritolerans]MCT4479103.1 DUF1998 domain-containing protein [Peribacillus frigoritolerans]
MNKIVGMVRPSQLITTFGPGAIVDLPDFSVIMGGINKWDHNTMLRYSSDINEPRLKKKLRINKIKSIPLNGETNSIGTIPAYRFPEFHICPACRKLGNNRHFIEEDGVLFCQNPCKKIKTHPVRFLTSCENGHIDDFPWGFYVHSKYKKEYDFKNCKLKLIDSGKSGSLTDLIVRCDTCDIERSFAEAYKNEKLLPKCKGSRPWLGSKNRSEDPCEKERKILLRGASNLYFPVVESSIMIPVQSNSNPLEELVREEIDFSDDELINDKDIFFFFAKRNKELKNHNSEDLWAIVNRIKKSSDEDEDLLLPEWDAITSGQEYLNEQDFEVEKQPIPHRYEQLINKLIRVKRLKEVMVLKGFTRINPLPDATLRLSGEHENNSGEKSMAPISDSKLDWLPGVESFGEGIFLSLNEDELTKWEDENLNYATAVRLAHINLYRDRHVPEELIPPFPGIRYILLHTLSHALIRELCLHSGYSSSALKERIYSDRDKGMAGILIYTATVDSEGSLGGLVELGKTHHFESILARALSASLYCSGDPLCAEHDPEQLHDINGAACHSCLLISETSCENSNRYLDRSILVKTVATHEREFFKDGRS